MLKLTAKFSLAITGVGLLSALFLVMAIKPPQAEAVAAGDWRAGRIIDDSVFYDGNSMNIPQIQAFLNSKVPVCDTNGTGMRGSVTRAQYGTSNGNPPPYTCLKDYRQTTTAKPFEAGLCNGYGAANHSAADIIYTVAQSCGISPKTLLVLLQKEQALITDDWPWTIQYRSATGYGCPDTAPCDSQYYGFFNQVYNAARGFKYYAKNPNSFNHVAGRNNFIRYNPDSNCGGSTISVQNQATAGLYNYTPYQPNTAALGNMYGTGDNCSAYGNRNFWRLFSDWFGSTSDNIPISFNVRLTGPISISPVRPIAGESVTVTYTVKNYDPNNPVTLQAPILQCRLMPNTGCDPGYQPNVTLIGNEERTFTHTFSTMQTGGTYALTPYFYSDGTWYRYGTDTPGGNLLHVSVPGMRLVGPIVTSPENPVAGDPVTVTYTVKNLGIAPISYQSSVLQCRLNTATNCDGPTSGATTFQPNEQRTFTYTLPAFQGGSYSLTPYYMSDGIWYKYGLWGPPANNLALSVPDIRLEGAITSTPSQPIPGQSTTLSYTVRNYASSSVSLQSAIIQCRFNTSANCDGSYESPLTLAANEQRTFTTTVTSPKAGRYVAKPHFLLAGRWYAFSQGLAPSKTLTVDVPAYVAPMELVSTISASPTNPIPGQPVAVTYVVRNTGSNPAIFQTSILQCRFNTHTSCDPSYDAPITINAGAQRTFTVNFPAVKAGTYVFTPFFAQNDTFFKYANGGAAANSLRIDVPAYVADMQLTGPITTSPANPARNQAFSASYTVINNGSNPAIFQTSILQCRRNASVICDPSYDAPITINAGAQRTFTVNFPASPAGTYVLKPFYAQNGNFYTYAPAAGNANSLSVVIP